MKNSLLFLFAMLLSSLVSSGQVSCNEKSIGGWQQLNIDYTAANATEYIQVNIANASARTTALFDNLTITETPPVIVQENHYDPWGVNLVGIEKELLPVNRYKFLGRETQAETGWVDLMQRMYDPPLGRFTSVDPVTASQESLSTYQYGWNNPVLRSDPNGDCPNCMEWIKEKWNDFKKILDKPVPENMQSGANGLKQAAIGSSEGKATYGDIIASAGIQYGKGMQYRNDLYSRAGQYQPANKQENSTKALITTSVVDVPKIISPNVQKILNTISDFKKAGGEIKVNSLEAKYKQELNMTFKSTDGSKLDLRVETHKLPQSVGGNGVSPQRHLNADVTNSGGNTVKMKHINGGHKILE